MIEYQIYLILALICLSIIETIEHHFLASIFSHCRTSFWYQFWRSRNPRNYLWDGYHLFKWLMLIFFFMTIRAYNFDFPLWWHGINTALTIWLIHKLFYENIWLSGKNKYWTWL